MTLTELWDDTNYRGVCVIDDTNLKIMTLTGFHVYTYFRTGKQVMFKQLSGVNISHHKGRNIVKEATEE